MQWERVKDALYPGTAEVEDFGYERVERLLRHLRGEPATDFAGAEGIEVYSDRVQPHSPGLAARAWSGGASLRSARWAGEHGMNLLASTAAPQGPARLLFAPDLVGTSEEIAEQLRAHPAYQEVDEVAFALPFDFDHADYVQILTGTATRLGPALGWHTAG